MTFTYKFYDKAEDAKAIDTMSFEGESEQDVKDALHEYCDIYGYEAYTLIKAEVAEQEQKTFTAQNMIDYLQEMMDAFKESEKKFGFDRETERRLDAMIACKEMVEALIQEPINLQKDGRVTTGF